MSLKAIIFDLDGVIVSTDEYHYLAWKRLAEGENIPYSRTVNERQRGVSRMESLEVLLEQAEKSYTKEEKAELAARKNGYYIEFINGIKPSDILSGVLNFIEAAKQCDILCAIGSSSKNTPAILQGVLLSGFFDAVADGNDIKNSKPHPEVFLLAAEKLGVDPVECAVIEDAEAGIVAAKAAGMFAVAVGGAYGNINADYSVHSLAELSVKTLITAFERTF